MTIEAAEKLQQEIDVHMESCEYRRLSRIELDRGSEVTDLTSNADVCAYMRDGGEQPFTICSVNFINQVLVERLWDASHPRPDMADIYTTGGPLIVVREIDDDTIVRSVIRYLELEAGRNNPWIPPNFRRVQEDLQ